MSYYSFRHRYYFVQCCSCIERILINCAKEFLILTMSQNKFYNIYSVENMTFQSLFKALLDIFWGGVLGVSLPNVGILLLYSLEIK